ncbi:type II secretion system protein N [Shewanella sp. AS16]|uniref:type II secretion system protein N n=1 Tax=Shewanella sp. AS16 TaxID=2907625 RepID=UPI001F25D821|nr:type II secretion system protein N [Shewanella sp. AS16]MCE9687836.1 type II secretion system protein N [Shewanella sp. AS16]
MSLLKKIILAVLIYLVFLLALFPAHLALSLAPLPANVGVSGVSGSIWSGRIESLSLPQRRLERLSWELSPWSLLLGKLSAEVQLGDRSSPVTGKGLLTWSMAGLSATGLRFEAPDSFILGRAKLPFQTQVSGDLSLFVETLVQGQPWCEALKGKVFLNQTQVNNQFGEYPLGDIEVGLGCVEGKVQLTLDEAHNQLGVAGVIQLDENNMLRVTAKVRETAAQPEDLKQSLAFLGTKDSQGYYPIKYSGRIPGL